MLLAVLLSVSLFSRLSCGRYCNPQNPRSVRKAFYSANLIRDMRIPAPRSWLDARFYTGVSTCLGNLLPVEFTVLEPSLKWHHFSDPSPSSSHGSSYGSSTGSSGGRPGSSSSSSGSSGSSISSQEPSSAESYVNGAFENNPDNERPIGRQVRNQINKFAPNSTTANKEVSGHHYYTVLFLDPDCDFVEGSGIRWVRTNVPHEKPDFSGDIVAPYFPPVMQTPTGSLGGGKSGGFIHRCVFLVYRQRSYVDPHVVHDYLQQHPTDFFAQDLVRLVNLDPIPTAGNFFRGTFNPLPMVVEGRNTGPQNGMVRDLFQ